MSEKQKTIKKVVSISGTGLQTPFHKGLIERRARHHRDAGKQVGVKFEVADRLPSGKVVADCRLLERGDAVGE